MNQDASASPLLDEPVIAFIGLGAMGMPMAKNLLAKGFPVRGYDIRATARTELAAAGGGDAPTVAAAFVDADIAVLMVVNAAQANDILFTGDVLSRLKPGAIVVLMATCPPAAVVALARRIVDAGYGFLDAPVSGGVVGATAASLTIMAAGAQGTLRRAMPVLSALGAKIVTVGVEPGQGATAKAVNQLLCGVHIAVCAEALSLAEKLGLDMDQMLDIVSGSAASSWMIRDRGPRMLQSQPDVTSAVDIFVKDLGIVLEAGRDAKTALPFAALAEQLFLSVSGAGFGSSDDSQVIHAYRTLQGRSS